MSPHTLPPALDRRLSPTARARLLRLWPWFAPSAFVGGFAFDFVTMKRVDSVLDNVILSLYLLAAGALLVLERRAWHGRGTLGLVARHQDLARLALQFLFGGLFNAYVIFYSQSATLGPSVLFCLVLAALMLANELWFEDLEPDGPQLALFFFCALSYLLFAVPLWTGILSMGTRVVAAILALGLAGLVLVMVQLGEPTSLKPALRANLGTWLGMLGALVLLFWLGLIPPVPLALSRAGIYRDVQRVGDQVRLSYESPPWWAPWRGDDGHFAWRQGDAVSCYTAVFAPTGATLDVSDVWERLDEDGVWQTTDTIPWQMLGGRGEGWRSWTTKHHVQPGQWRVRVVTAQGIEIGRVRFEIQAVDRPLRALRTTKG